MPKDLSDEDKKSEIKKSILERKVKIYVTQSRNWRVTSIKLLS